ncbi:MAG: phenylalanine--tRNA ligase subunit beta [Calditrichia bacterium]
MKISYNWLQDYLDLTIDPYELADRLSMRGLEVEEVSKQSLDIPGVVVGKVISCSPHPSADRLSVCEVDVGTEQLTIVCGAPNVARDQMVAVARVGALLPNGMKIKKTKIRGVPSEGMICSEQELQLAEESEGIWVLPENLPVGMPLNEALEFKPDFIFDIAVTPNRPDCLSHIGVAREVAAILDSKMTIPPITLNEAEEAASDKIKIRIDNPEGCPRYSARYIENIQVGKSPNWLVRRLEAVGMRSVNNVVDATNYVMLETGHPLHAFDYDLIQGGQIVVRDSREGEKFITLDNQERTLKAGTVLICDEEKPVAIGGIMGGLNSEVTQSTRRILLESAYFTPERIQISSQYLGLSTEASQRFERGADPNGTRYAIDRAAQLISELCGGKVFRGAVDAYVQKIEPRRVPLKTEQINTLLGTELSREEMVGLLNKIDLKVEQDQVVVPTFRPDIERVADLAEEIARLYGLDNIPASERTTILYAIPRNELDFFTDCLKDILISLGLQEVITGSMINKTIWEHLTGETIYPILNPISRDLDGMRNTLIPSLAQVARYNYNRQMKDLRIFEIGRIFHPPQDFSQLPEEQLNLGILLSGLRQPESWYSSRQLTDFFDIKGIVESLFHKISLDNWKFIYYPDSAEGHEEVQIEIGGKIVGRLGQIPEKIRSHFELEAETFVAEIAVLPLFQHRKAEKKYKPIPRFPAVERDLALVVDNGVASQSLLDLIWEHGGKWLSRVEIFDIYRGKQIEAEKKSLAFHLVFQSTERTLTEEEVNFSIEQILREASRKFGAKLRE